MSDFDLIVSSFADKLSALLLREMRGAIESAPASRNVRAGGAARIKSTRRIKGQKRTQAELEQLRAKLLRVITDNEGKRVEELSLAIGLATRELVRPLKQLIEHKMVRATGERRGTRYFATGKGSKS